eukprot:CAMPEP_0172157818 /NCGR_PEP_ID=MMETSP1050-20130122/4011_1 /TAXON_ID=233186 /ORGANISM="Cryptomonas curvata, Strain CCAP979/52" /LENGTH=87 /DNA_ID=CAMNT_0012827107 /DNA_START=91 /DNA_END=351 /DNA_ORIENTATION=-
MHDVSSDTRSSLLQIFKDEHHSERKEGDRQPLGQEVAHGTPYGGSTRGFDSRMASALSSISHPDPNARPAKQQGPPDSAARKAARRP